MATARSLKTLNSRQFTGYMVTDFMFLRTLKKQPVATSVGEERRGR